MSIAIKQEQRSVSFTICIEKQFPGPTVACLSEYEFETAAESSVQRFTRENSVPQIKIRLSSSENPTFLERLIRNAHKIHFRAAVHLRVLSQIFCLRQIILSSFL
ncbi:hypothetical protein NPIL_464431 [Nephila pilipes]|uniref:Uncharacterized protein n=1 Tax=Nephila pilipes TaxID=299642 RepID=A0A8X6N5P5_NEPPI|nr:hypothetical protein NPIL_464431 [Nephila pilipes]